MATTMARSNPSNLIRIAITAIAAGLVWFRVWEPFPHVSLIGIAGVLFGGWPIFEEALENMRGTPHDDGAVDDDRASRRALPSVNTFTALIITVFVLAAEVLEELTVEPGPAGASAISSSCCLAPPGS